jgi:amino acid transporter
MSEAPSTAPAGPTAPSGRERTMTVRGAAFLGIGSMVGAGIFALLGQAGAVAGSAVWISFLIAGGIATLQGYAIAKLGATYPSSGGIVTFLLKGFGPGRLTAVTSWLLYFASLIVSAMVATSFGSYGASLFSGGGEPSTVTAKLLTVGLVVAVAVVNIAGTAFIDRIQSWIVIALLAVFAVFVVVTLSQLDRHLLAPSTYPPAVDIVSSIALTFFAFLGFAVISFTGGDLPQPAKNLPRAMYLALGITTLLYVLVSFGVFGTLTVDDVVAHGDTALAEAARPVLGDAGFAMMAVAALLATSSSVNANIYAAVGSTSKLAESGTFPPVFGARARVGGTRGLTISAAAVLVLALFVDLTAIASLGSAVALLIFLMTSIAALRLRHETGSRTMLIVAAIVATAVVLVVFAIDTLRKQPATFVAMVAVLLLAIVLDLVWTRTRERRRHADVPG